MVIEWANTIEDPYVSLRNIIVGPYRSVFSEEDYRVIPDAFVLKISQKNLVTVSEQIPNATFGISVYPAHLTDSLISIWPRAKK
ncbi:MAG: hypothetical protein ACI9UR_000025 [Bacteroidia bacterium]|jgi:hypothetical protein